MYPIGEIDNMNNQIDEIVNGMSASELRTALLGENDKPQVILEGGNMFPDVGRINQENVAATLRYIYDEILPALDIDRKYVQPLGSVGKKLPGGSSGDLDLGIDANHCEFLDGANTADELAQALEKHATPVLDDMGLESRYKNALFSIKCPIQNFDGKQEGEFVQLDMMVTRNPKFQNWSQYAPQEIEGQTYYKGWVRNLILEAVAHAMDDVKVINTGYIKEGPGNYVEQPVEWEEYSFYTPEGLNIKHVKLLPMTKQPADAPGTVYKKSQGKDTDSRSLVTNDPDVIAKKMFGPKVKGKDLLSWEGAWEAAHDSEWAKDPKKMQIFKDALKQKFIVKMKTGGGSIPPALMDELGIDEQVNESSDDDGSVDSHRHSLTKIYQLSGNKLRSFLSSLVSSFKDGDVSLNVKTTPKIDGNAFRIGWYDGRVYVENSGSGVVDASGEEIDTFQKPQQRIVKHLLGQGAERIFSKIEELGLKGVKVTGELLVNGDDLMDDDGTITYVGTTYNAHKLGNLGSIVLFQAEEMDDKSLSKISQDKQQEFIEFLCSEISDAKFSYFNLEKFAQSIEVKPSELPAIKEYLGKPDAFAKMKKDQIEGIRDEINEQLTSIYKSKFKNPEIMTDDGILEGVVFSIGDNMYGINYQDWKDRKHQNTSDIDAIREFPKEFLSQVTGIPPTMPFLKLLNAIRSNPDEYQERYQELLPQMMKKRDEILSTLDSREDLPRFLKDFAKERGAALMDKFADGALTDDVMSLVELIDGKTENLNGETIALVPGSFRPPHKGHFEMIKHYATTCDKVVVGISKQTNISSQRFDKYGRTLTSEQVKQIFEIYTNAAKLTNVEFDITPKPMQWIGYRLHHLTNCKVVLGVSSKDDVSRFEQFTTEKFKETIPGVEILDLTENSFDSETMGSGEPISATYLRDNIDDRDVLRKVVPDELSDSDFEQVFSILNPSDKEIVSEGGHAIFVNKDGEEFTCSRIDQENVSETLEDIYNRFVPLFGLTKDDVACTGSTGKRLPGQTSGDIDLAFDQKKLMEVNGIETPDEFIDLCQEVADKLNIGTSIDRKYGWKAVSYAYPIANVDGKQEDEMVQLDLVVSDDMEFTTWTTNAEQEEDGKEYVKSAIRNIIFNAIARGGHMEVLATGEVKGEGQDAPVEMNRMDYDYKNGLFKVHRTRKQKKDGTYSTGWTVEKEFLTKRPDEIVHILYSDDSISASDIMTPRDAWDALIDSDLWLDSDARREIERCFTDEMARNPKLEMPSWVRFNQ